MGSATGGRGGAHGETTVGYVVVQQGSAPIFTELPGRVSAYQISDVRPQVNGVILHRLFKEGSLVKQGQTLYQIDPSIYQAQTSQAQANLQSARAQAVAARTLADRYGPLVKQQAISKQDYTNAVAQARQAEASVAQNSAALHSAQINLHWTRVPAPISGRIGLSNVTEGALVTSGQTQALTTITRLDPVYVDVQQSAADLLALRRALAQGGAVSTRADVRLAAARTAPITATPGSSSSRTSSLIRPPEPSLFVRPFANPQALLLPGMFVKARFAQAIDTSAFLVPQQAVTRDPQGQRDPVDRRSEQYGRPAHHQRGPDARPVLGRDEWPRRRRQGDHSGNGQSDTGREGQGRAAKRTAKDQGAAARRAQEDEREAATQRFKVVNVPNFH